MKQISLKLAAIVFVLISVISCKSDDDGVVVNPNHAPTSENVVLSMNENPTSDSITTIVANDVDGDVLTYSIASQTPIGSIQINETTGEVFILDINSFDYEQNTLITASIVISDGTTSTSVQLTINILDINDQG